tara:strand:+ start:1629 stop:2537 length:909 start_codon:yes stop_codon:yes gene_type:complete
MAETARSDRTKEMLDAPLPRSAIHTRKQAGTTLAYVEGWWIIQKANEIFGYDGWETKLVNLKQVDLSSYEKGGRDMWRCTYTCEMSMEVHGNIDRYVSTQLDPITTHQDVGVGTGFSSQAGDAIEGACKEAVTDALKRCARHWGNQFGLALYDKKKEGVEEKSTTPSKPPKTLDSNSNGGSKGGPDSETAFFQRCKDERDRIGQFLYQKSLDSIKQKSAKSIKEEGRTEFIEHLERYPDLESEEGTDLEIGRLISADFTVQEIVNHHTAKIKGKMNKATRKLMVQECQMHVNQKKMIKEKLG